MKKTGFAVALGLTASLALVVGLMGRASGQPVVKGPAIKPARPPVVNTTADSGPTASQYSAIKLDEKTEFRQYLDVARDCIKDKAWQDAVTALQTVLDSKEDFYAKATEVGPDGKRSQRWISVKFEANSLLGSMPEEGLDVYEQRFGAAAKNKLAEAKNTGSRELLAEVAQRYMHTKAGIEANDLLATYFMDRGQFFMAALRFEKLFAMNPERVKIEDMTLFKAALAYRRAGDMKNADLTWRKLEPRLSEQGGLKIGGEVVDTAKLKQVMEETARPESNNPFDWPYIRGDVRNAAQAHGTPPLLDVVLFQRDTVLDKTPDTEDEIGREARIRIDQAIAQQNGFGNAAVLPGSFPIASNNLLVYRSYADIRAVYLQDEKDATGKIVNNAGSLAWKSTDFSGALASVLHNDKTKVTCENWLNRFFNTPGFSNVVYENTLNGTLSTDHRLVYAIDDLSVPATGDLFQPFVWNNQINNVQISQEMKPLVLHNTLDAYNLRNGSCIWRLGDERVKDERFANSHFLGAPIVVGGKLYVLNEKNPGATGDSELRLVCIDPYKLREKGEPTVIEPIQSLGTIQQQHRVTHDISRRLNAVHLAYGEGMLVCPTNAGEILGVDLLSRSLAWAYPYREQMPTPVAFTPLMPQPFGRPQPTFATTSAANWHSAPPVIQEGKVVFTAPDANSVHCINLRDGTPVWKKKQAENDLYLAGVFNGKVLIVGKTAVRALSLEDGRQVWYVPTGDLPSGQGVASNNIYYLPLKKGEIMALDINKGQIKAHNRGKNSNISPGNLVFYEGAVISQTPTQIVAYPQLAARLELARVAVRSDPNNPAKLVDHGELLLADGQVQTAVDELKKALASKPAEPLNSRARLKLYEGLTDLLAVDFVGASNRYLDEYRALCDAPENSHEKQLRQARYFRIVGQGREAQGNLVEAFQMYREFGSLPIHREQGGIAALDDPSHKVPTNVWLRGRVSAMIAKATPEQREPLEKKIAEEWKTVEAKKDIDAIRSFVGMFDVPFIVGREARLRLADLIMETNDRSNFLEAELSLYQLRGADYKNDPRAGGRALAALAQLEEKKGSIESMKLAAAYYRELARTFAGQPVRLNKNGSQTGADLLNELDTDPRFRPYIEEPRSPWGNAKIAARELPAEQALPQGYMFLPEGDLTPPMKQQRLVLDSANNNNPELRLLDLTTNSVRWKQSLGLVQQNFQYYQYLYQQAMTNSSFYPNAKFRFFQVKGNLIVFQVGSMVYCLDADNAKILWQHNLIEAIHINPGVNPGMMAIQVLPDHDGYLELITWNQLNGQRTRTPIGHVGAVEASYVALVTQKGLEVLDPIRGTLQWKKMDVHPSTRVFGDDKYLYLVDTNEGVAGSGRILRASDGMEIAAPDFGGIYQNRLKIQGGRVLAAIPGRENVVVKLYDMLTGKDVWSRSFDPKTLVLQTEDPGFTGVLEPGGKLIALDASSGRILLEANVVHGRVTMDELKNLKDGLLLRDADHWYVALNKPVDPTRVAGGILANNFNNNLRCSPVNGWFLALHRNAGKEKVDGQAIAWSAGDFHWHSYSPMSHQMIVLEQFDRLPMILFSCRYNELINGGTGGNRWISYTQSIDKRTGKVIYDPGARTSNSAPQFHSLDLDLVEKTVKLRGFAATIEHYIDKGGKQAGTPLSKVDLPIPQPGSPNNRFLPPGNVAPQVGFRPLNPPAPVPAQLK